MIYVILMVLFVILSIILFYILWINGYLIKSKKTALLFIGSFKRKNGCKIKLKSCKGYIKKVIKIK